MRKLVHSRFLRRIYPILCVVLLYSAGCAHNAEQSDSTQQVSVRDDIDQDRRGVRELHSCVIKKTDGYGRTPHQAEEDALENARKKAKERILSEIQKFQELEEIHKLEIPKITNDYGKENDGRYHVEIEAEVQYSVSLLI